MTEMMKNLLIEQFKLIVKNEIIMFNALDPELTKDQAKEIRKNVASQYLNAIMKDHSLAEMDESQKDLYDFIKYTEDTGDYKDE